MSRNVISCILGEPSSSSFIIAFSTVLVEGVVEVCCSDGILECILSVTAFISNITARTEYNGSFALWSILAAKWQIQRSQYANLY